MTLSPAKSLSVSSAEEFLSEIEPSIMWPRKLIGLEWMKGIEDETSGWSDAVDTELEDDGCCVCFFVFSLFSVSGPFN